MLTGQLNMIAGFVLGKFRQTVKGHVADVTDWHAGFLLWCWRICLTTNTIILFTLKYANIIIIKKLDIIKAFDTVLFTFIKV